jgi:RNA polymerase sigma factor (sigma-70 family)
MKLFAKYRYSTDRQFVADLLANDGKALECLLYDRYRSLLRFNAMKAAPNVPVDDLVQELYLYLSADGWARLKKYDSELPFDRWLSVVSYRFFKDFSLRMIDSRRQIPITNIERSMKLRGEGVYSLSRSKRTSDEIEDQQLLDAGTSQMNHIMMDIKNGLDELEPPRDRKILTALILHDEEPQAVADRFGVTVDNLYNIKRRALAKLIAKHLEEYKN